MGSAARCRAARRSKNLLLYRVSRVVSRSEPKRRDFGTEAYMHMYMYYIYVLHLCCHKD